MATRAPRGGSHQSGTARSRGGHVDADYDFYEILDDDDPPGGPELARDGGGAAPRDPGSGSPARGGQARSRAGSGSPAPRGASARAASASMGSVPAGGRSAGARSGGASARGGGGGGGRGGQRRWRGFSCRRWARVRRGWQGQCRRYRPEGRGGRAASRLGQVSVPVGRAT